MLASVLHLSIEDVEELFVFQVVDIGTPGVGKFEESIFQFFIIKLVNLSGCLLIINLYLAFFTFLLRFLSILTVTIEVFSDDLGEVVGVDPWS